MPLLFLSIQYFVICPDNKESIQQDGFFVLDKHEFNVHVIQGLSISTASLLVLKEDNDKNIAGDPRIPR